MEFRVCFRVYRDGDVEGASWEAVGGRAMAEESGEVAHRSEAGAATYT